MFDIASLKWEPLTTMERLWSMIHEEGVDSSLWHEGSVKTFNDFVEAVREWGFIVYKQNTKTPVAFCWLNGHQTRRAFIHFSMFRASFPNSILIAKTVLHYLLNWKEGERNVFDVLVGMTPESNKVAVKFLSKVGMQIVGTLPHAIYFEQTDESGPAVISYITREETNHEDY